MKFRKLVLSLLAIVLMGGLIMAQAFASGLVDEFHAYVAPLISGLGRPVVDAAAYHAAASVPLVLTDVKRLGPDVKLSYRRA